MVGRQSVKEMLPWGELEPDRRLSFYRQLSPLRARMEDLDLIQVNDNAQAAAAALAASVLLANAPRAGQEWSTRGVCQLRGCGPPFTGPRMQAASASR